MMQPRVRRLVLAVHLGVSVGWLGGVIAYLPFDVIATTSREEAALRAAYTAMDLIASRVLVPLALSSVITGVAISIGTRWGLFHHWWVLVSLLLTTIATIVLLVETPTISALAAAAGPLASAAQLRGLGGTLPHSLGGLAVLIVILVLNVYKPTGMTPYGWRRRQAIRRS